MRGREKQDFVFWPPFVPQLTGQPEDRRRKVLRLSPVMAEHGNGRDLEGGSAGAIEAVSILGKMSFCECHGSLANR